MSTDPSNAQAPERREVVRPEALGEHDVIAPGAIKDAARRAEAEGREIPLTDGNGRVLGKGRIRVHDATGEVVWEGEGTILTARGGQRLYGRTW